MTAPTIAPMRQDAISRIGELEAQALALPQAPIATHHVLHAGVYVRSIMMPAGTLLIGALVDIPTTLILCGDCTVAFGDGRTERFAGYHVLAAARQRKGAYLAHADTVITMAFATCARSVEEAEGEFTAEADRLMSRRPGHVNTVVVTGL